MCHFALDSTCHPFVEQFTRESGVTHCEIETEFDNMLLRRDGYDPLTFFTASHIHPSAANARVIAPFYRDISEQTALEALKGMILVHKALARTRLPAKYVVLPAEHKKPMLSLYQARYDGDVTTQVIYACKAVMEAPRHGAAQPGLASDRG